ncbi:MAG: GNAT family N-acetyltransferase [Deltaproteobacteria bacterium]|nr:GNAT family N-acetyltransferase [Deltaproteobacteria bacterium]
MLLAGWAHEGGLHGSARVWPGLVLGAFDARKALRGCFLMSANGVAFPLIDDAVGGLGLDALIERGPPLISVIVGKRALVEHARQNLRARGFREITARQQTLYEATRETFRPAEPLEVTRVTPELLEPLAEASRDMSIEEADDDPEGRNPRLFRDRLLERIARGRDFARFEDGELVFKANVAALSPVGGHLEGIFVPNALRRRGLGRRGTSTMTEWVLEVAARASLLVNDHNTAARSMYESLGYEPVEESLTLYVVPP